MIQVAMAIIKKDNLILSISRKDNHLDFGLIGGKVEPGETPDQAVIREVREEVGLVGVNPILIDIRTYRGKEVFCYIFQSVQGWSNLKKGETEEGFIAMKTIDELRNPYHSYHDYNSEIFKILENYETN